MYHIDSRDGDFSHDYIVNIMRPIGDNVYDIVDKRSLYGSFDNVMGDALDFINKLGADSDVFVLTNKITGQTYNVFKDGKYLVDSARTTINKKLFANGGTTERKGFELGSEGMFEGDEVYIADKKPYGYSIVAFNNPSANVFVTKERFERQFAPFFTTYEPKVTRSQFEEEEFEYMDGGALKDVGGTQYNTTDLSGMFANGGVVSYVGKDDHDQSYFRRYNGAVGSFQWQIDSGKNRRFAEGILYPLTDFDRKYYSHIKLRDGEVLLRYKTDIMRSVNPKRGEGEYLIKINLDNGMIYFMSNSDDDDDKNPKFETRGIKAKYIRITSDYAKKLEDGGNLKMVKNQAVEVGHHSEELKNALKKDPKVDAWVVSKMGNLTGELSDVTHYLEGENNKFADGGKIKWQDVNVGDSANVRSENKTGIIVHSYGRKFHLKFVDGSEKTYDASDLDFIVENDEFAHGGMMARGGSTDRYWMMAKIYEVEFEINGERYKSTYLLYPSDRIEKMLPTSATIINIKEVTKMADGGMMASGGGVYEEYRVMIQYPSENQKSGWASFDSIDIIVQANSREMAEKKALSNFKKTHPNKKGKVTNIITTASNNFSKMFNQSKLKDGGMMSKGGKIGQRGVTYFIGKPEVDVIGRFNKKRATWNTCKIDDNGNKNFSSYTKTFYGGSAKIPSDGIKITKKEFDKLDFSKADTMADGGMMARGGDVNVEVGDMIKGKTTKGRVYESSGIFFKLEDEYGTKSPMLYSTRDFKKSEIIKKAHGGIMAKGGMVAMEEVIKDAQTISKNQKTKTYVFDYEFNRHTGMPNSNSERYTWGYQEDYDYHIQEGFDKFIKVIHVFENGQKIMMKGGMMAKGGMTEHGLRNGDKIIGGKTIGTTIRVRNEVFDEDARVDLNTGKRTILTYNPKTKKWEDKMAMGGKVKFSDKVKSISKSLLKRKKVSPSVQKDYGKTYSKKEAVESAKRIAGAMRKKETAKKKSPK